MKNPWLGLSSYTEESVGHYQFNGRDAAIGAVVSMIRRNLFVTLYGRSGIGKTSLLQAGVYPVLRRDGFSPVTIRLNDLKDENDSSARKEDKDKRKEDKDKKEIDLPSKLIWEKTVKALGERGCVYRFHNDNEEYDPDFSDVLVFRKLFSAGRFLDAEGEEVIPVIVLDQFEEVLYKAPGASRLLISQLYALIDDSYNMEISRPD